MKNAKKNEEDKTNVTKLITRVRVFDGSVDQAATPKDAAQPTSDA